MVVSQFTPMDQSPPAGGGSTAEIIDLLHRTARRLRRESIRSLTPLGLTPGQDRTLRLIGRAGDAGLRMGELASLMSVVPRTATGMVDGLEAAALVERWPDPESRRSVLVRMAERGHEVQQQMAAARINAGADLLASLDDAERAQLAGLLRKIAGDDCHPR